MSFDLSVMVPKYGSEPNSRRLVRRHRLRFSLWLPAAILLLETASGALAADWPQILGLNRNGIAVDEKVVNAFPSTGPEQLWEAQVGSGFAGAVVSDKIVVLFHRLGNEDTLTAFDAESGRKVWSQGFETNFQPQIVNDDGPRAVPTISEGRVYALGSNGGLYCVDIKSGKPVWTRQTHDDFQTQLGYFGAGSSPLVDGKLVIVNVGGDKGGAGVVAFHRETGETVWKSTREQASYSSPIIMKQGDLRHLLCITRLNLVGLDPQTGEERFRTPFGQRGPTVNAAIPVLIKNQVLVTASYGIGAELLTIHPDRIDVAWKGEVLSSQYTTPILHDGAIYGIDGRQDGGTVTLTCFDPSTQKVHWTKRDIGYSTLIAADGKLIVMQTDGVLRLVELKTSAYRELAIASVMGKSSLTNRASVTRALPALANGRFYVRNEDTLKCLQLGR